MGRRSTALHVKRGPFNPSSWVRQQLQHPACVDQWCPDHHRADSVGSLKSPQHLQPGLCPNTPPLPLPATMHPTQLGPLLPPPALAGLPGLLEVCRGAGGVVAERRRQRRHVSIKLARPLRAQWAQQSRPSVRRSPPVRTTVAVELQHSPPPLPALPHPLDNATLTHVNSMGYQLARHPAKSGHPRLDTPQDIHTHNLFLGHPHTENCPGRSHTMRWDPAGGSTCRLKSASVAMSLNSA